MLIRAMSVWPKSLRTLRACVSSAWVDRRTGVFLSRASPVHDTKAVGMARVVPLGFSMMKAGLVTSHAVYPRASKVWRMPPLGKLDASGSPWMSILPLNSVTALPSLSGTRKESCFSAVSPVSG